MFERILKQIRERTIRAKPTSWFVIFCGKGGALLRHVTRSYGKGARLLVIENVPLISCPHCGESYMTAATLHEIERIKRQRLRIANKRPVAVAVFA